MNFRTLNLDIINNQNEPNYENVSSGTIWISDTDTLRVATASGVRELRTSHRVSYSQQIDTNAGISRSVARTNVLLNSVILVQSSSHSYHRLLGAGSQSAASTFFVEITSPNSDMSVSSSRIGGLDTLEFITGCSCCIERISSLRNPSSPGAD